MISPGEMPPALKAALLDTPSATICAGVSCRTQQSRFRVFGWSRHSLPESQIPPNIGHFRKELATGCQPEVRTNSKWDEFGSPNRIRTDNLSVNSGPREGVVNLPVCKLWPFCQRAEGWPLLRRVWLTFVCAERYLPCSSSMD